MEAHINVQPLTHKTRKRTFLLLVTIFLVSLPFLYMYATGYRFDIQKPTTIVSTGGIYIGVERTGAEIYIDNELVRETRTFRKAFYAQGLDAGTHRVHVQKEGYHTWVKELPVSKRLVTEADAFNLPLVPQVRVISPWVTATGTVVVKTPLTSASSTNELIATTTLKASSLLVHEEFKTRLALFGTSSPTTTPTLLETAQQIRDAVLGTPATSTDSDEVATTTIISNGAKLYQEGDDVYAVWVGSFEQMPYYYCAADFEPYTGAVSSTTVLMGEDDTEYETEEDVFVMHPVQSVPEDEACDPTIRIDRMEETVHDFDFFPGNTELVLMVLDTGVYVVEIDDRGWQNVQPLFLGENLQMAIESGIIYLYDGELIYQVVITTE